MLALITINRWNDDWPPRLIRDSFQKEVIYLTYILKMNRNSRWNGVGKEFHMSQHSQSITWWPYTNPSTAFSLLLFFFFCLFSVKRPLGVVEYFI